MRRNLTVLAIFAAAVTGAKAAGDTAAIPSVVKTGREGVRACADCHGQDGSGRPQTASLAGLDAEYIKRQIGDFKNGNRAGSGPEDGLQRQMIALSRVLTEEEVNAAAAYFAGRKFKSAVTVIESETVRWIVESPREPGVSDRHGTDESFIAFVPKGSLARGEGIVAGRGCAMCHGAGWTGIGDTPRLAGRSPSYLLRQLGDFKTGKRGGASAAPMRPIAADTSTDDMIAIAAFLASQGE